MNSKMNSVVKAACAMVISTTGLTAREEAYEVQRLVRNARRWAKLNCYVVAREKMEGRGHFYDSSKFSEVENAAIEEFRRSSRPRKGKGMFWVRDPGSVSPPKEI